MTTLRRISSLLILGLLVAGPASASVARVPAVRSLSYINYPTTNLGVAVSGPAHAQVRVSLYGVLPPEAGSCILVLVPSPWTHVLRTWSVRLNAIGHATLHIGTRTATGCYAWAVVAPGFKRSAFSGFLLTIPGTVVT